MTTKAAIALCVKQWIALKDWNRRHTHRAVIFQHVRLICKYRRLASSAERRLAERLLSNVSEPREFMDGWRFRCQHEDGSPAEVTLQIDPSDPEKIATIIVPK